VPDVLVLDLNLPGLSGAQVCAALTAAQVPTRILILSASGDHQDVLDAVKAGALGYLVKSAGREEFLAAVRATAAGEPVFTAGLAGLVLGEFRRVKAAGGGTPERPIPELTDRETEILKYVATGMGYKEIASTLFLSHRTVQNHVQNIFGKLQMHNRVELVRFAMERGLDLADPT
jgi:DNA-binding NarL/FixJ family response regulator